VTVVVTGRGLDGRVLVERRATTRFIPGEVRGLDMFLARRCEAEGVTCDDDETCTESGCRPADVPPEDLPPIDPGGELDAGRDAARDGGPTPIDSGDRPDAAAPDAGDAGDTPCTSHTECDDGDPCTTDRCAAGTCLRTTRDADGDRHGDATCAAVGGVPADDCNDGDPAISPAVPEDCNGADDDCDTLCDDGFTCCRGIVEDCLTTCRTMGRRTCVGTCSWSVCSPPAETCNGVDDDCNGSCDDAFECCSGASTACTTACGSRGTSLCAADCSAGACVAPAESCNGTDDDCDSNIDEGFACREGTTTSCTTSCGSTGTRTCGAACTLGTCTPPAEACGNGDDDDCDTMIDEGCIPSCGGSCPGATVIAAPGGRFSAPLVAHSHTGSCGGAGSEARFTFTLTATSDVFLTTHGAPMDTVLYVRSCSCTGTEVGCNDDADGRTTSVLRLTDLPGGTYSVFADTETAMSATVTLDAYITAPGTASDRCGDPGAIAAGATMLTGSTAGYTDDYQITITPRPEGCAYSAAGNDLDRVFYFYVPTTRNVVIDGCTSGTRYDSVLYVRRVCTDDTSTALVDCNDDGCGGGPACDGSVRSSLSLPSLPAGLYYLFVDGYPQGTSCSTRPYQLSLSGL
jgi:hypothetical protein